MSQTYPVYVMTQDQYNAMLFFLNNLNNPTLTEGLLEDFIKVGDTWYGNGNNTMTAAEIAQMDDWVVEFDFETRNYTTSMMAAIIGAQ